MILVKFYAFVSIKIWK